MMARIFIAAVTLMVLAGPAWAAQPCFSGWILVVMDHAERPAVKVRWVGFSNQEQCEFVRREAWDADRGVYSVCIELK